MNGVEDDRVPSGRAVGGLAVPADRPAGAARAAAGPAARGGPAADGQGRRRRSWRSTRTPCSRPTASSSTRAWSPPGPGSGTFVTRTLTDTSLAAHGPLRQDLRRWLAKARQAGLDDESIEALFLTTFRTAAAGGHSMTAVLQAQGLGKRYGRRWALTDCTLDIPAGRVVGLVGPNGAGKSTLLNLAVGMLDADHGHDRGARRRRRGHGAAGQGRVRRPGHPDVRRPERRRPPAARRPAQPGLGRGPRQRPDRAARARPEAAGRQALRRPARAARAHARASPSGPSC